MCHDDPPRPDEQALSTPNARAGDTVAQKISQLQSWHLNCSMKTNVTMIVLVRSALPTQSKQL